MTRPLSDYEQLGAFYLGRPHDLGSGRTLESPLLYDAKDLTTHAVIVGMTGSGKTGLGIALLEEAAIDGVPSIVIDPKGDLTNLALTFPRLAAEDFRPWIESSEATRAGRTVEEQAANVASRWREGLARWDQDGERIERLRRAAEVVVYTPGSVSGRPISALDSLGAPGPAVLEDSDALRERIGSAVSGLLALLGVATDPLRSREHVLLSSLLDRAWRDGRGLDLAGLVREVLDPPMDRVGVLDLESFFPADERAALAMRLNNLLASPAFAAWTEGEPLDVARLLVAPDGRPRISVLSIAHLSDPERMFFVTLLLQEVVGWMRAQPGTQSLRALLYMDEVMGYLPPTANPPSKTPLLTLLKQARASGLGVVVATQNPVDLDYKALSNAGTWFLGRLQTERDRARVLDGLEGASVGSAAGFDRAQLERTLGALGSRVFLLHNVHEDAPVIFETRWCLSYLRGPLSRDQVRDLAAEPTSDAPRPAGAERAAPASPAPGAVRAKPDAGRPALDPAIEQCFLPCTEELAPGMQLEWRPAVMARATLHYQRRRPVVDAWRDIAVLGLGLGEADPWAGAAVVLAADVTPDPEPTRVGAFASLPAPAARAASYGRWAKRLATSLYRDRPLELLLASKLGLASEPDEDEANFRARLRQALHERRDEAVEALRKRHGPKLARLIERIRRAEQQVEREREQYRHRTAESVISVGATVLGALLGRKLASVGNVGRASTAARRVGRAARERGDIGRAAERLEALRAELAELESAFEAELGTLRGAFTEDGVAVERLRVPPRKSELDVRDLCLVWTPWLVGADGRVRPGHPRLGTAGELGLAVLPAGAIGT